MEKHQASADWKRQVDPEDLDLEAGRPLISDPSQQVYPELDETSQEALDQE
jgi:hypothetical protein